MRRAILVGLGLAMVLIVGLFLWARSVLTGENVRAALAAQVGQAIGQPVTIGDLGAGIFPRVTVRLGDVRIGRPERVTVASMQLGTDVRALLSRRIEHATVRLAGARLQLPLPPFTVGSSPADSVSGGGSAPVELVSIDEIILSDVEVVSGDRTLHGDIELVPRGQGVQIRKITLKAEGTSVDVTGDITDLAGPQGHLTLKAAGMDLDRLAAFAAGFAAGAGASGGPVVVSGAPAGAPSARRGVNVSIDMDADKARLGGLTLTKLSGQAKVTDGEFSFDPVSFGIFGGTYQGTLSLVPNGQSLRFRGNSTLANVDVASAMAFAGSPNTLTGVLNGRLEFSGAGIDLSTVTKSVRGKGRVDVTNGVIKNLGLIDAIVVATSMRTGAADQAAAVARTGSKDEPFSRLGATLDIAGGAVSTPDLTLESKDVLLAAQGAVDLQTQRMALKGRVQLSDALSQQAGRDLVRYTQEQGRVTLPVTIGGTLQAPAVSIDVGDLMRRALQNEATKALGKSLGGLFGR